MQQCRLAYHILGSWADAEDAVQDPFLKWQGTDRSPVENPASWLTTACTRRCIDMLRAPNRAAAMFCIEDSGIKYRAPGTGTSRVSFLCPRSHPAGNRVRRGPLV
ncbi:sigma factor [Microvirga yunnanensis]|uniref:sigma factor n=1 Tax=Microvirga yunnanensis TaxID=2953740 RepID=UPI0021CAA6AC|nr:sigma factor [Microvirga sp. HBU65207]